MQCALFRSAVCGWLCCPTVSLECVVLAHGADALEGNHHGLLCLAEERRKKKKRSREEEEY